MKTIQVLTCSLAVGAMLFAAGKASASAPVPQKLTVSGTVTYTNAATVSGTTVIDTNVTTKTVSFNNKTIIGMLNASAAFTNWGVAAAGTKLVIPTTASLGIDTNGNVIAYTGTIDAPTAVINLSTNGHGNAYGGFAGINGGIGPTIGSLKVSTTNVAYSYKAQTIGYVWFYDGGGNYIEIDGLDTKAETGGKEVASGTYAGMQKVTKSGSIQGYDLAWWGRYASYAGFTATEAAALTARSAFVEGKASASGSGYVAPGNR